MGPYRLFSREEREQFQQEAGRLPEVVEIGRKERRDGDLFSIANGEKGVIKPTAQRPKKTCLVEDSEPSADELACASTFDALSS